MSLRSKAPLKGLQEPGGVAQELQGFISSPVLGPLQEQHPLLTAKPSLRSQHLTVLHRFWGSNSGPHTCMAITLPTSPPPACLHSPWKYHIRLPVSLNLAATSLDKVHITSSQATSTFLFTGQLCQSAAVSGRKQGIEKLQQPDAISGKESL